MLTFFLIALWLLTPAANPDPTAMHARIQKVAQSMIAHRHPDEMHRLEIKVLRTGGKLESDSDFRLDMPESVETPRARLQVRVQQKVNNQWENKGWAMLYIAHFDSVGVTTRILRKDEQVSLEDLRFTRIETTKFRGIPLTPRRLQKLLTAGEVFAGRHLSDEHPLKENDIRNAYDIELGQSVVMTYTRNQFALQFTCKARMSGFRGEEIKIYAPATRKTYRVQITGPGETKWLETLD